MATSDLEAALDWREQKGQNGRPPTYAETASRFGVNPSTLRGAARKRRLRRSQQPEEQQKPASPDPGEEVMQRARRLAHAYEGMSPEQWAAIDVLMAGGTVQQAADAAGVHNSTIYRWRDDPAFQGATSELQAERIARIIQKAQATVSLALGELYKRMKRADEEKTSDILRVFEAVADRTVLPRQERQEVTQSVRVEGGLSAMTDEQLGVLDAAFELLEGSDEPDGPG